MALGLLSEEAELVRREGRRAGGAKGVRGMAIDATERETGLVVRRKAILLEEALEFLGHKDHCIDPGKMCSCGSDELKERILGFLLGE